MTDHINAHLAKLGFKVRDLVTGMEGVIVSVSFDLYGCVQAIVNPGLDKDGKPRDSTWHDISRLELISKKPVMQQPDFVLDVRVAQGRKGPAEKPTNPRY
jgi:hypothetical protein